MLISRRPLSKTLLLYNSTLLRVLAILYKSVSLGLNCIEVVIRLEWRRLSVFFTL